MNGVCCRRLLDNLDKVFCKIQTLVLECLHTNKHPNKISTEKLLLVVQNFQYLFEVVDLVFSNLRILCPTKKEMENTKESITRLEQL